MAKTLTNKQRRYLHNGIFIAVISLIIIAMMFPFFVMVVRSLMTEDEIYNYPKLLPKGFTFGNYYDKTYFASFMEWGGNTLTVAIFNIVGIVCSAFLCAYGFAKVHFKWGVFGTLTGSRMQHDTSDDSSNPHGQDKIEWRDVRSIGVN